MKYPLVFLMALLLILSCSQDDKSELKLGVWRAELQVSDDEELPFLFEVTSAQSLKIFNAEEVILVNDISYENDSLLIRTPVFEGVIKAAIKKNRLDGVFVKEGLNRVVPFSADFGLENRFISEQNRSTENVQGNWEVVFSPNSESDRYIAKGIFSQEGDKVIGTFRTTTGDYRYLEGIMDGDIMKLSTFDGAHAFLFTAKINGDVMEGQFYSGNHWKEPFSGIRNADYELPDANTLTYLKEGYDSIAFRFPDSEGQMVALTDKRFKDKVVVAQIMGTWCPNCLDETKFYSEYYNANRSDDLEFIALAFEYVKSEEKAFQNIARLKEKVGINYPIVLAQYGSSDKSKALEKMPMLNHVFSYPTTIFIDKKGKVRKIHTGFNGPATGEKYQAFKSDFTAFIDQLRAEE